MSQLTGRYRVRWACDEWGYSMCISWIVKMRFRRRVHLVDVVNDSGRGSAVHGKKRKKIGSKPSSASIL